MDEEKPKPNNQTLMTIVLRRRVGHNVARLRSERQLTRADLGLRIGRSERVVAAIEAGTFRLMISQLALLANALDVPAHVLVGKHTEKATSPKIDRHDTLEHGMFRAGGHRLLDDNRLKLLI